VDHVTQWSYCSGAGGGFAVERPDITEEISRRRLAKAAELEVDTLVSACVWSERPLSARGRELKPKIEVRDLMELVAESVRLDYGGVRR
jgi:heterodisulfide reductase subunit D